MADIAMLVAEEYERRIKLARKTTCGDGPGAPSSETGSVSVSGRVSNHGFNSVKWIPKSRFQNLELDDQYISSPMAVAALDGFFSA